MSLRKPTVVIPAYTTFPGGGLMHFLKQGILALASQKPDWNFVVLGSISLKMLEELKQPNIQVVYIDGDRLSRMLFSFAQWFLCAFKKSPDTGFLIQSRFERYHLPWGNPGLIQRTFACADLVWIPNYSIAMDRLSLTHHLAHVPVPRVFTIHDIHPAFFPEDHSPELLARFYKELVPFACDSQAIITHSDFQKEAIVQQLGINPEKIWVTFQPPLIDPSTLLKPISEEQKEEVLKEAGINGPYVFYPASTVHVHKNHYRLLVAWSMLKDQLGSRCPMLVCTGKGSRNQWSRITRLIHRLGIQDQVIFLGQVSNTQLSILYRECELVVLPTLYEGAGSGILTDAYEVNKLVLCARIPQIEEQMKILQSADVDFFNGMSARSIFEAVMKGLEETVNRSGKQETKARETIQMSFLALWEQWSGCYTDVMEELLMR